MELTRRQQVLFDFIIKKHGDQKRKYTFEPYYLHLYNVATIVSQESFPVEGMYIEVALGHDLFEDTKCEVNELFAFMTQHSYTEDEAHETCHYIDDLSDKFTSEKFPKLNRAARKSMERDRLSNVPYLAQTVKYADLIDNTSSIVQHDRGFAQVYLHEKALLLEVMSKGHRLLYWKAIHSYMEAMEKLHPKPLTEKAYKEQMTMWQELFDLVSEYPGASFPVNKLREKFKLERTYGY